MAGICTAGLFHRCCEGKQCCLALLRSSGIKQAAWLIGAVLSFLCRYMRTSLRVDNLPSAVCRTATGLMLVPLPGKRGVTGWTVNTAGQVRLRAGV